MTSPTTEQEIAGNIVERLLESLREVRCNRQPFTPEHADCVCRLTNAAAEVIETIRLQKTGLEALLCDAQQEIAELRSLAEIRTTQRDAAEAQVRELRKRNEELDEWLSNANRESAKQRAAAETYCAALRPFAEAYRVARQRMDTTDQHVSPHHFARAAELIPDTDKVLDELSAVSQELGLE